MSRKALILIAIASTMLATGSVAQSVGRKPVQTSPRALRQWSNVQANRPRDNLPQFQSLDEGES